MSARWIDRVLVEQLAPRGVAHCDLELLADAVLRGLPGHVIAAAIAESAAAVLRCQHEIPRIDAIAKEIGNNAAQAVLLMLEVDDGAAFDDGVTDDVIRALRDEARFSGDHERARCCNAALGIPTGDGAGGTLDQRVCRDRVVAYLKSDTYHVRNARAQVSP